MGPALYKGNIYDFNAWKTFYDEHRRNLQLKAEAIARQRSFQTEHHYNEELYEPPEPPQKIDDIEQVSYKERNTDAIYSSYDDKNDDKDSDDWIPDYDATNYNGEDRRSTMFYKSAYAGIRYGMSVLKSVYPIYNIYT